MTLTKDEIKSQIMMFVSGNAGCNVATLVHGLAKQHRVSPSTISKEYHSLIYDKQKNPDGVLIVEKPSGFRGGHEPFKVFLKQDDFKKQLDEITALLERYERTYQKYFPNMRKGKLMVRKSLEGYKYYTINKKYLPDFNMFCVLIDSVFQRVSGFSFAKATGLTPKEYDGIINDLQKRTMAWIIKEINYFLNQQSKAHNITRWNVLMNIRSQLSWLIDLEFRKPDLFYNKEWLKDGVIY